MLTRSRSQLLVAGTALGAHLLAVGLSLLLNGGDVSRFVVAGDAFARPEEVPEGLTVLEDSTGYDGQFFYRLALNPLSHERRASGILLDVPVYRQGRIGYPLAVWGVSWGKPRLALWMMVGVNLAAIAVIGYAGAGLALPSRPGYGLAFALYPGLLLAVLRDLADVLAIATLLAGLLAVRQRRWAMAAILLAFGGLTRETTLLAAVALGASQIVQRLSSKVGSGWGPRVPIYVWSGPLVAYASWVTFVRLQWGGSSSPDRNGFGLPVTGHNFGLPFEAIFGLLARIVPPQSPYDALLLFEILFLGAFFAWIIVSGWRAHRSGRGREVALSEQLTFAAFAALTCLTGPGIWEEDWAFLRVCAAAYVTGSVLAIGWRASGRRLFLVWTAVLWLGLVIHRSGLYHLARG